jgi:hypothetical protein
MYLRNVRQFLRSVEPGFDERRFGFASIHDIVRQAQREGVLRIERNRQGILRIFPGDRLTQALPAAEGLPRTDDTDAEPLREMAAEPELADAAPVEMFEAGAGDAQPDIEPEQVLPEEPAEPVAAARPPIDPDYEDEGPQPGNRIEDDPPDMHRQPRRRRTLSPSSARRRPSGVGSRRRKPV